MPGALDQRAEHVRGQVDGVDAGQPAAPLAHRRADGVTDDGIPHGPLLVGRHWRCAATGRARPAVGPGRRWQAGAVQWSPRTGADRRLGGARRWPRPRRARSSTRAGSCWRGAASCCSPGRARRAGRGRGCAPAGRRRRPHLAGRRHLPWPRLRVRVREAAPAGRCAAARWSWTRPPGRTTTASSWCWAAGTWAPIRTGRPGAAGARPDAARCQDRHRRRRVRTSTSRTRRAPRAPATCSGGRRRVATSSAGGGGAGDQAAEVAEQRDPGQEADDHVDGQQGQQAAQVLPADQHQHAEGAEQAVDRRRGAGDRHAAGRRTAGWRRRRRARTRR